MPTDSLAPGVTAAEMLNDQHGCRGLHQRRLRFDGTAALTGTAGGHGEAWYVIRGSGTLGTGTGTGLRTGHGRARWVAAGRRGGR